jgi:proteic killer suppression protein
LQIRFRTRTLQQQYENSSDAIKAYGKDVATKFIQRIDIIKTVRNVDELIQIRALRCHPLKGNREGQWALKLTGFARLIFTLEGDQLEIACIEEVSKHYDD